MTDVLKINGVGTASNLLKADGVALANLLKWNGLAFPSGVDADAQTFIDACHTAGHDLTANEQTYLNTLVVDLKAAGVWTKCIAIYPMVGGDAKSVVINLKNPGTFNLTLLGSPTVDDNGIDFNGTTQYAKTGIIPSSHLSLNDVHIGVYIREKVIAQQIDIGSGDTAKSTYLNILSCYNNGTNDRYISSLNQASGAGNVYLISDSRGDWLAVRRASNDVEQYRNGASVDTDTGVSNALGDYELYLGARNTDGSAANFSTRQQAFATVGTKLTDTEATNRYNAIQDFQTSLGRNI